MCEQPKTSVDAMREVFEAWTRRQLPVASFVRRSDSPDDYCDYYVNTRWQAWRAALVAASADAGDLRRLQEENVKMGAMLERLQAWLFKRANEFSEAGKRYTCWHYELIANEIAALLAEKET